ncbi:hypothetical protein PMAC_001985 [Pneumocystis sp. 'macacae']|nr:hypothetical protein PMAC_001985 [Pneumocystis sp. 'macacae']
MKKDQQSTSSLFNVNELWGSTNELLTDKLSDSFKKENHQINNLSTKSDSINKHNYFSNKHINTSKDILSKTTNSYNFHMSSPPYSETSPVYSYLPDNTTLTDTQMSIVWSELSELKVRVKKLEIADKWRKSFKFNNLETPEMLPENVLSNNLSLNREKYETFHLLLHASLEKMKLNGVSKELWAPLEHIMNEVLTFQDNNCEKTKKKINSILRNLTELSLAIYDYHQSIAELNYSERKKRLDHLLLRRANSEQNITPLNRRSSFFIKQYQKNVKPFRSFSNIENIGNKNLKDFYQSNSHQLYMKCNCNSNQYINNIHSTYSKQKIHEAPEDSKISPVNEDKTVSSINPTFLNTPLRSNFINNTKYRSLNEYRNNISTYFS